MGWFPGLRGLSNKSIQSENDESKTVYSAFGTVLENSGRFGLSSTKPNGGEWTIDRALNEAFNREPYAFKAVDTIAEKSSSLEFKLKDGEDEVDDHPLYRVLNAGKANPLETGHQFRKRLSYQVLLNPTRGAFVNVVKSRGGDITSCALLPPDRTFPIPNESDPSKLIAGFKVLPKDGSSKPTILSVEEVRWVRNVHPLDPFSAASPLSAAGMSILMAYFARLFNLSFMRNDGRPGGILSVESDMTDADMDRIEAKFGRGPMESGKLTVVGGKAVYNDTGQSPRDMAYQELAANAVRDICVAFGVPESQMGHASDSTFSNADAEGYGFWVNTMGPHNNLIATAFHEDSDERLVGYLDTSDVVQLQEPLRKKREEAKAEWESGLRSLISYAELAGITVPDIPETRAFYIKQGTTPIPGDEADRDYFTNQAAGTGGGSTQLDASAGDQGSAGADSSSGGAYTSPGGTDTAAGTGLTVQGATSTVSARRVTPTNPGVTSGGKPYTDAPPARSGTTVEASPDGKALEGKAEAGEGSAEQTSDSPVDLLDKTEAALNAAAEAVINRQANVVVARLKSPKFKKGTKHWVADESKPADTRIGVKTLDGSAVVQADRWEEEMVDTLTPIVSEACQSAAEGIIDDLGLDDETKARHRKLSDKQAKAVADVAADALFVAKSAIKKHSESLAARIKEADEAGKDLDAIIADIQAYAEQYRRGWSRQVMVQVGQVAIEQTRLRVADLSKNQRDIVRVWVSRKDDKVRPSHKAANGERVRLGQPFKVGSASLRFPGDPLGPPSEVIGCRCRTVFRSKATGRAVRTPKGEVTSAPERKALELVWSVA